MKQLDSAAKHLCCSSRRMVSSQYAGTSHKKLQ